MQVSSGISSPRSGFWGRGGGVSCFFIAAMVSVLVVFAVTFAWIFFGSNHVVATQIYTIDVVNEYNHDPGAFSQVSFFVSLTNFGFFF